MNRLAHETSPYLRQHAANPVDWYPWGEEAFAEARRRDVPILLSVGYAACHWCHVMAHESFEDTETARLMNELFVCVKVDREERPDVDSIYMEAVQAMTGHGGWPMTAFLTPGGEPFHGGTYYPKVRRGGMPSFTEVCTAIATAWREQRPELLAQAGRLIELLQRSADIGSADIGSADIGSADIGGAGEVAGSERVAAAAAQLLERLDRNWGGFGSAPKFPQPDLIDLLLRHHRSTGDPASLEAATSTLGAMAAGGVYDHLGGGFHRYAVDRRWLVPHFEKMLYDQAGIARAYLHAWQLTGEDGWLQVLGETVDYVRRDLRHPDGGFYSSEDADSEGEEGRFYVWTPAEVEAAVGGAGAGAASRWWGVAEGGNFEGRSILHRPLGAPLARPAEVEGARVALLEARGRRIRPGLDDKVLTEWNALFIATLAEAAAATGRDDWLADARAGAGFLLANLRRADGRWRRSWQQAAAAGAASDAGAGAAAAVGRSNLAFAADYAALVGAFTRLAEATGEARWMAEARAAADGLLDLFWDTERGGVFTTGHDADPLITRPKDVLDGVVPSANGSAAVNLARLAALTGDDRYRDAAEAIVALVSEPLRHHPTAFAHLLAWVDVAPGTVTEVAVVGERPDLVAAVHSRWRPGAVLAWGEPYPSPLFEAREAGMAYVCRNYACKRPTADPAELAAQLGA